MIGHWRWESGAPGVDLEAEVSRLRLALARIAGREPGMGVHRACCGRGAAIASDALDTSPITSHNEPAGDSPAKPKEKV